MMASSVENKSMLNTNIENQKPNIVENYQADDTLFKIKQEIEEKEDKKPIIFYDYPTTAKKVKISIKGPIVQKTSSDESSCSKTNARVKKRCTTIAPSDNNNQRIIDSIPKATEIVGLQSFCEIGTKTIPFVRRRVTRTKNVTKKYVIGSIAEKLLFCQYSPYFTEEFAKCIVLPKFKISNQELYFFNELNENYYKKALSPIPFTKQDFLVLLEDVYQMSQFLKISYEMIFQKKKDNRCFGFLKINRENSVPFVRCNKWKFMPLMYFDGFHNISGIRFNNIADRWQLNYLRLCFKIQKINEHLYENFKSIRVVEYDEIRKFFPPDTSFEIVLPSDFNEALVDISSNTLLNGKIMNAVSDEKPDAYLGEISKNVKRGARTNMAHGVPDFTPRRSAKILRVIYRKRSENSAPGDPIAKPKYKATIIGRVTNTRSSSGAEGGAILSKKPKTNLSNNNPVNEQSHIGSTNVGTVIEPSAIYYITKPKDQLEKSTQSGPSDTKLLDIGVAQKPMDEQAEVNETPPQKEECIKIENDLSENPDDEFENMESKKSLVPLSLTSSPTDNEYTDVFASSASVLRLRLYLREKQFPFYKCVLKSGHVCYVISLTQLKNILYPEWTSFARFEVCIRPHLRNSFRINRSTYPYGRAPYELGMSGDVFAICWAITDVEKACAYLDLLEHACS